MSAVVLHSIALRATLLFEGIIPTFASDHSRLSCRFHGSILSSFCRAEKANLTLGALW